ncbi:MAG: phenol hydroxylase subunit [Sphingomonadales bacterium]|nr:phenol hydroxylase subunit [Sphingomonadales bacterium]
MKGETDFTEADIPPGRNCVRVFGVKRDLFVEFDFIAGDPTLQVELVLPFPAFQEFCSINDVKALPVAEEAEAAYERLCWRFGARPGRPDDVLAR